MEDLGTLGGDVSRAYAVSANGMVTVGTSGLLGNSDEHAFLHDGFSMVDLAGARSGSGLSARFCSVGAGREWPIIGTPTRPRRSLQAGGCGACFTSGEFNEGVLH